MFTSQLLHNNQQQQSMWKMGYNKEQQLHWHSLSIIWIQKTPLCHKEGKRHCQNQTSYGSPRHYSQLVRMEKQNLTGTGRVFTPVWSLSRTILQMDVWKCFWMCGMVYGHCQKWKTHPISHKSKQSSIQEICGINWGRIEVVAMTEKQRDDKEENIKEASLSFSPR